MSESSFDSLKKASSPPPEAPWVQSASRPDRRRRWWIGSIVIVAIFLAGLLPMWLKAGLNAHQRDTAQREVRLLQLESLAAAAAIDARRGEYESARQGASRFFTALLAELDRGSESALAQAKREPMKTLLTHRDDLVTLLARSDAASAERLTEVYLACRKSLRGEAPSNGGTPQHARP